MSGLPFQQRYLQGRTTPAAAPQLPASEPFPSGTVAQRVTLEPDARARDITQIVNVQEEIYFQLQIFDRWPPHADGELTGTPLPQLQAGRRYWVRLSASKNRSPLLDQTAVDKSMGVELYLRVLGTEAAHGAVWIDDTVYQFKSNTRIGDFDHVWPLEVATDCPVENAILELSFRDIGRDFNLLNPAARLPVHLAGTYYPLEGQLQNILGWHNIRPPASTVLLRVEGAAHGYVRLSGWHRHKGHVHTDLIPIPGVGLETFDEQMDDPRDIVDALDQFSEFTPELGKILGWLSMLIAPRKEAHRCVVILDEANSHIPWELIKLAPGKYLGAEAVVARWIHVVSNYAPQPIFSVEDEQHMGTVVGYLAPSDPPYATDAAQENQMLQPLAVHLYNSVDQLEKDVPQRLGQVGLIYLSCRGILWPGKPPALLNSLRNPYQSGVVRLRFNDPPVAASGQPMEVRRPVVFANALYSGRVLSDNTQSYGLVKVLLAKLAAAYIGTLGPTASKVAAGLAADILKDAGVGIRPAERLRQLRAEALRKFQEDPVTHGRLLIYTFMYVYYGNPHLWLRVGVAPADAPAQEAEHG